MTELPILFSASMVRAILKGRKTQTRRVVKPQPTMQEVDGTYGVSVLAFKQKKGKGHWIWPNAKDIIVTECPYGEHGDRLWVREAFTECPKGNFIYREQEETHDYGKSTADANNKWTPSIYMPRRASRITLEITNIRVERLQDISDKDALAEGVDQTNTSIKGYATERFKNLWESINGAGSWDANPWVWVIEFKRVKP